MLNERPEASVGDIAKAAGLTRPTVYAHYPSREALLAAVIDHVTAHFVAAVDAADLDHGPATAALRRYLAAGWQALTRHPLLLHTRTMHLDDQSDRHQPIHQRPRHVTLVTHAERQLRSAVPAIYRW